MYCRKGSSKVLFKTLAGILLMTFGSSASALYVYRVKKGDTLSQILNDLHLTPIYARNGSLPQTLKQNPALVSQNHIYPGQEIILPVKEIENKVTAVSVATRAPADNEVTTPAALSVSEEEPTSSLKFASGLRYFRIDAIDSVSKDTSRLSSKLSPDVSLGWDLKWDDLTTVHLEGGIALYSFQALNANQSYVDGSGSLNHFSIAVDRKLTSRFTLGGAFYFQDEIFLLAQSSSILKIDTVMIIQPALTAHYDVLQKGSAVVGLMGEARLMLPSNVGAYDVKTGSQYRLGIYLRHEGKNNSGLEGQFTYGATEQDSSIMSKSEKEMGIQLQYRWGIF